MTFRARLRVTMAAIGLGPLAILAIGVRREVARRLTADYESEARALAVAAGDRLTREAATVGGQLASLNAVLASDNRFRTAALSSAATDDRSYLLDYASHAMALAGLSVLQIQNEHGRILSSGHFRNEFDRQERDLDSLLAAAPGGAALVSVRTPDGPRLVLARIDSLRMGNARYWLVGGADVGPRFLGELASDSELSVALLVPDRPSADARVSPSVSAPSTAPADVVAVLPFPAITSIPGEPRSLGQAHFVVRHSLTRLARVLREVDGLFVVAILVTGTVAVFAAGWLADRIARPLTALASQASRVDLDRPDGDLATDRDDEVGALSRLLAQMVARLRSSAARLQETERRAVMGDLARQVSHDVKNGLVPIRHVLTHLAEVEHTQPDRLASVFAARRGTLEASVAYLDSLARCYGRLTPAVDRRACDVNAMAQAVAVAASATPRADVRVRLEPLLPPVHTDPLAVRRMIENLVTNAIDALAVAPPRGAARSVLASGSGARGVVTIATERGREGGVRITVADDAGGPTGAVVREVLEPESAAVHGGAARGLGLSIVRRLAADIHASMRVETSPATGTRVTIDIPSSLGLLASALPSGPGSVLPPSRPAA